MYDYVSNEEGKREDRKLDKWEQKNRHKVHKYVVQDEHNNYYTVPCDRATCQAYINQNINFVNADELKIKRVWELDK